MFSVFLIMGIVSMKNAKRFATKAESENELKSAIREWCSGNLSKESIDSQMSNSLPESDEILYFKRVAIIKNSLNKQFINLNPSFLDHLIDEELYDDLFGGTDK